jgi:DNA-binding CsgD family transcriptional regulator
MEDLDTKTFKEIYEIINMANFTLDRNVLRKKIMEFLFKKIYIESSVFFLPDKKAKSTGGIEINIDEKYVRQYKEYYHLYDPIQLIKGSFCQKRVIQLEELIDYHSFVSSKFYCDFLKPQKIHHKLYINLHAGGRFQGRIALYRPVKSKNFSKEEANILSTISPYLAHALDHNDLYINIKLQDNILKIIENKWSTGLILLDYSMQLIYMNQKAKEFCIDLIGYPSLQDIYIHVPLMLLKDCYAITEELKRCPADFLVLPRCRVIRINSSKKFSLCSHLIEKEISSENCRLFMISIEEMSESRKIDQNSLKKIYYLTDREIDIALHIFKGLRNAEIAQRLFVSEITVKKHIQNIFQKLGVKTRTALIHRILDKEYIPPD